MNFLDQGSSSPPEYDQPAASRPAPSNPVGSAAEAETTELLKLHPFTHSLSPLHPNQNSDGAGQEVLLK